MKDIKIVYPSGNMTINLDFIPEWSITDFRGLCKNVIDISENQADVVPAFYSDISERAEYYKERAERIKNVSTTEKNLLKKLSKMLMTLEAKYPDYVNGKTAAPETVKMSKGIYHVISTTTGNRKLEKVIGYTFEIDGRALGITNKKPDHEKMKYWIVTDLETGAQIATYKSRAAAVADVNRLREIVKMITSPEYSEKLAEFKKIFDDLYKEMYGEKKEEKTMKETKYFENVKTLEELRTEYKNLLKENHPDNGGAVDVMQNINAQYDARFTELKASAKIETKADTAKWSDVEDAAIRNAIAAIIGYPGLNIEIVGCWVWVDGNTYECKDDLKTAGYKWSRARKKWHFAPYEKKFYKGSKKSFEQLRREYGSTEIEENEKIA